MATTTKGAAIAAPQIFTSDPIEQTYAKDTLDPYTGGIAYAFLNAARGDRERQQQQYMSSLGESNRMAMALQTHAEQQDTLRTILKELAPMANAGIDPTTMPLSSMVYGDPSSDLTRQPSALSRSLKAADTANKLAQAAKAGADAGPQTTYTQDYTPTGSGDARSVTKGRGSAAEAENKRVTEAEFRRRGFVPRPDGTWGLPVTGSAAERAAREAAAASAAATNQRLNARERGGQGG